jgi:predicted transcriptional regulator
MNTYLMSLKPEPLEALYDGRKLHEFRRRFSQEKSIFQVVFYISAPVKAICAVALFDKPIVGNVDELVQLIKTHKFSSEESLRKYLVDKKKGVALPLVKIKKIKPLGLSELRQKVPNFVPPQSYMRYDFNKFKAINDEVDLYET